MNLSMLRLIGWALVPLNVIGFLLIGKHTNFGVAIVVAPFAIALSLFVMYHFLRKARLDYIKNYQFPSIVMKKFMEQYPKLSMEDTKLVEIGLKQFFMLYALCQEGTKPKHGFLMPSRLVDELWHNFMLDSANYYKFCKHVYGGMFHHKPGPDNGGNKKLHLEKKFSKELTNTYEYLKKLKDYTAVATIGSVPVLFALDSLCRIENGFYYDSQVMINIENAMRTQAVANSTSDSSGSCGGLIATDSAGSCSSGDGGSCGGGCGGGGD